jgi:hypothetical protein
VALLARSAGLLRSEPGHEVAVREPSLCKCGDGGNWPIAAAAIRGQNRSLRAALDRKRFAKLF